MKVVLAVMFALLSLVGVVLYGKWREGSNNGGQLPADPFRIAGNLYYVGANDVTSFLITGDEGHVLIDGGYPGTPPLIMASIAKLGFDIRDVKVLLNSEPHFDHAGGLAELQQASGAEIWASEANAESIESGGEDKTFLGPFSVITKLPLMQYPGATVSRRFQDGALLQVGPIRITAHITPGHVPGCTTFSFTVREGERDIPVIHRCSLTLPPALGLGEYPDIREDFEQTFRTLRSLPGEIWLTAHAREFGRYRKYRQRDSVSDPVAPFLDRAGYLRSIDSAEVRFRAARAKKR